MPIPAFAPVLRSFDGVTGNELGEDVAAEDVIDEELAADGASEDEVVAADGLETADESVVIDEREVEVAVMGNWEVVKSLTPAR
jgi:hypothetical protein